MFSQKDILTLWNDPTKTDFEKRVYLAAIIACTAEKFDLYCVLVGGAATEIYTSSNYATSDIDFITSGDKSETEVMTSLGFERDGKSWGFPETGFSVEFPKGPLDGDLKRIKPFQTELGTIPLIGIEDIIIDRCSRVTFWGNHESYDEADEAAWRSTDEVVYFLLVSYKDKIDWEYLSKKAIEAGCEKALRHYKKHYNKLHGDIDERNPKRQAIAKSEKYTDYLQEITVFSEKPTDAKKRFFYFAKEFIDPNNPSWSSAQDEKVIEQMRYKHISLSKQKKAMLYSPSCFGLTNLQKSIYCRKFFPGNSDQDHR